MKRMAIFASGKGSNAEKICEYFQGHESVEVALIVSNKADAGVREVAGRHHIPFVHLDNQSFQSGEAVFRCCEKHNVQFIVLAGFLRKIPDLLLKGYSRRIINIHPALLPKYGGPGMYGMHVHRAVKEAGERESGITIHFVNAEYDKGRVIFQATCDLDPTDQPEDIAQKVHALEHAHYPKVIEQLMTLP